MGYEGYGIETKLKRTQKLKMFFFLNKIIVCRHAYDLRPNIVLLITFVIKIKSLTKKRVY